MQLLVQGNYALFHSKRNKRRSYSFCVLLDILVLELHFSFTLEIEVYFAKTAA